jgi:uncharacterized protein YheU (UPF0270 family)
MRNILISAILLGSVAIAAPAAAQYRGGHDNGYSGVNIQRELSQLRNQIHRGEDRDRLSNREERRLLNEVSRIDNLYSRYRRNGLDRREARDLEQRIQMVRQQIRAERRDDRRGTRW